MPSRTALIVLAALLAGRAPTDACADGPPRAKASFKVLFSNDTTNITSCVSPFHEKGQGLTDDMLRATIDEAAGADVQMLQPGCGWIPWWKSKVYPAEKHYRYHQQKYGIKPNAYGQYMLAGGDLIKTFVEHCRKRNLTPFVSLRLNDGHGLEYVGQAHPFAAHTVSRFYEDHYLEYRIGPNQRDWNQHVLNWAIPEVRDHKFAFIEEICENYDLDGFELDFMRHNSFFQLDKTSSQQRREIITAFVRRVRELLDRTARAGRHRWLCVRVPAYLEAHDPLGIDLAEMVAAGVDMINLSCHYYTVQQTGLGEIRKLVPETALYLEMTHTTTTGPSRGGYDSFSYRRTTPEQFFTTAHLAYRQGADGMSLFNFVYYREHGTPGRGPFNEPPFHVLAKLGDPDWLARQAQWYFLAKSWRLPTMSSLPLPKTFKPGQSENVTLELAPTEHQRLDGTLRLMTSNDAGPCTWTVELNGTRLEPTEFVPKPIDHPYDGGLGQPSQYACFACPRSLVREGANTVRITLETGKPATLQYLDLVLP